MSIEVKISRNKVPYKKSMFILEKRVEEVQKGLKKEFLWILEHPTTYTGGIRSCDNEILDKTDNNDVKLNVDFTLILDSNNRIVKLSEDFSDTIETDNLRQAF